VHRSLSRKLDGNGIIRTFEEEVHDAVLEVDQLSDGDFAKGSWESVVWTVYSHRFYVSGSCISSV
jgi:hypothetical protein